MKYSVGQKVKIRSLEWYRDNVNRYGIIECGKYEFFEPMNEYCGKVVTIKRIDDDNYRIDTDKGAFCWTDEMIEGLVEEAKLKFKVGDEVRIKVTDIVGTVESIIRGQLIVNYKGSKIPAWPEDVVLMKSVEEENQPKFKKGDCVKCADGSCGIIVTCDWSDSLNCYQYYVDYIGTLDAGYQPEKDLQPHTITTMNGRDIFEGAKWKHEFECPDSYIFKDENGNVINAQKIVLEKKKKEYPKTYGECCKVLGIDEYDLVQDYRVGKIRNIQSERIERLNILNKLLICRDAYWKLYGEEMGLGKPWRPNWNNISDKYCIYFVSGDTWSKECQTRQCPFAFPTAEMRDAFKENFDPDIEFCKELL